MFKGQNYICSNMISTFSKKAGRGWQSALHSILRVNMMLSDNTQRKFAAILKGRVYQENVRTSKLFCRDFDFISSIGLDIKSSR